MCFVSNVSDWYGKQFEPFIPDLATKQTQTFQWPPPSVDLAELRKLIDDFKAAMAAAKTLDFVMKQPDCVDPEKAKLEARVAELEAKLKAIQEAAAT